MWVPTARSRHRRPCFLLLKATMGLSIPNYLHTSATAHRRIAHQCNIHRAAKRYAGAMLPLCFDFLISLSVWILSLRPPNWQPARRNPTLGQVCLCDGCQVDGRTSPFRVQPTQRPFAKQNGHNRYLITFSEALLSRLNLCKERIDMSSRGLQISPAILLFFFFRCNHSFLCLPTLSRT